MNSRFRNFDLFIPVTVTVILSLGITIIYSVDPSLAGQQIMYAAIGAGLFLLFALTDYRNLRPFASSLYFLSLILLILVLIFGVAVRGSVRWFDFFSVRLQPSEVVKPFIIIALASYFSRHSARSLKPLLLSLLLIGVPAFLVFRQPDLGGALVLGALWLAMAILAGLRMGYFLAGVTLFAGVGPLVWNFLHDYQRERIMTFLNPFSDPLGKGYNVIQSTIAVGSGQLFGRGLGRGTQSHLQFLPEHGTDFIFASLAEELGLLGALLLVVCFAVLFLRLIYALRNADDTFGALIVAGTFGMILFQFTVNVGMNIGIVPVTGITLPLVSYGGSSLLATMVCLGMSASVLRHRKEKEDVHLR